MIGVLPHRLALAATIAMLIALAGCGDDSTSNSADEQTEPTQDAPSPLAEAYDVCGPQVEEGMTSLGDDAPALDEVIRLVDDGDGIIVTTPEPGGDIASVLAFTATTCVLEETGAPETIAANMEATTAASGQGRESYEGIEVQWSYVAGVGNAGFNATFDLTE